MKTISLKKVSAVAVASLGFGLLSVVPANAAATAVTFTTAFTATGSTTTPVAGSIVTVPVTLAASGTFEAATGIVTATLTTRPTNSALTAYSTQASVSGSAAAVATAGVSQAATAATSSAGAFITNTATASTTTLTAAAAGVFTFTPDTAGYYVMTLTTSGTGTQSPVTGSPITVGINVSGAALVQANSGLGASTGAQIAGRQSAAAFFLPAASTTASRYTVTATGATIVSVKSGASLADAVNANTYTSSTGVTTIAPTDFSLGARIAGAATTTSVIASASAITDSVIVQFTSATAGTAVVTLKSENVTTGALTTVATATVTYGSADLLTLSVANTTIYKASGTTAPTDVTDPTAIVADATVGTQRANILVTIKNGNNTDLFGQTVVASIAGPGLIAWSESGSASGTTRGSVSTTQDANENVDYLVVNGDGSGGVATITFTIGTTVLGTETITFYGAAKNLAVTVNDAYLDNAGGAAAGAVFVKVTDAQGVVVPSATVYAKSADTTKVTVASTATTAASATTVTTIGYGASFPQAVGTASFTVTPISAAKGAVVLTFGLDALYATSATATVNIVDDVAVTATMALDKSSYTAGSAATLTITAKDVNGDPVADDAVSTAFLAAACVPSLSVSSAIFAADVKFKDGKAVATFFMPASAAPFTVSCKLGANANQVGALIAGTTLTASATVTDGSAALNTRIDSLNAKIVALTALIAKIMKSLKIK